MGSEADVPAQLLSVQKAEADELIAIREEFANSSLDLMIAALTKAALEGDRDPKDFPP